MTFDSPGGRRAISGDEFEDLIEEVRDVAGERLGLTNYVHIEDSINLADDGTFTLTVSKHVNRAPASVPSEKEILRRNDELVEINLWEKELFWSWDDEYMVLRASVEAETTAGLPDERVYTLDEQAKDMSHWQGCYLDFAGDRGSIVDSGSGEVKDAVFGDDGYGERVMNGSIDQDLDEAEREDVDSFQNDEVSQALSRIHGLWFGDDWSGLRSYFHNPSEERAFDLRQRTERTRVKMNAQKLTEILNDVFQGSRRADSTVLTDNPARIEELYSCYNGLDNEVRPNGVDEEFDEAWSELCQEFRVLFDVLENL